MELKPTYAGCGESRDGRPETYAYGRVFCPCDACDEAITAMVATQEVPCPECHGEASTCPTCYGSGYLAPIAGGTGDA